MDDVTNCDDAACEICFIDEHDEEKFVIYERKEWKEHDDARRYREYESDNRRPY